MSLLARLLFVRRASRAKLIKRKMLDSCFNNYMQNPRPHLHKLVMKEKKRQPGATLVENLIYCKMDCMKSL